MIVWDVYTIKSTQPLHGVKFRGRLRLFALKNELELLTENASDVDNAVRFAVCHNKDIDNVKAFIKLLIPDAEIACDLTKVKNPVLSKLIVNNFERYE